MIGAALEVLLRDSGYELLGRARSGSEALEQVDRLKPDLLLLDVNMPDGTGLEVLDRLSDHPARPAVILLTAGMDDPQLVAADELVPEGVVLKTSDPALLLECMDAVSQGKRWVDPEILERTRHAKDRVSAAPSLTRRECEIVELVSQGMRNRDIAERIGVTEGTVKVYLHAVFEKLGVENRTELAMRAADVLRGQAGSSRL